MSRQLFREGHRKHCAMLDKRVALMNDKQANAVKCTCSKEQRREHIRARSLHKGSAAVDPERDGTIKVAPGCYFTPSRKVPY